MNRIGIASVLLLTVALSLGGCCNRDFSDSHLNEAIQVTPECIPTTGGGITITGADLPDKKCRIFVDGDRIRRPDYEDGTIGLLLDGPYEPGELEITVEICRGRKKKEAKTTIIVYENPSISYISDGSPPNDEGGVCGGYMVTIAGSGFLPEASAVLVEPAMTPFFDEIMEITATEIVGRVASHVCWPEGEYNVHVQHPIPGCDFMVSASVPYEFVQPDPCSCSEMFPVDPARHTASVAIGNFNADLSEHNDIIAGGIDGRLYVYLGAGDGAFTVADGYAPGGVGGTWQIENIAVGDFDGDGRDDVAISTGSDVRTLIQPADGGELSVSETILADVSWVTDMVPADLDADGNLDLAVVSQGSRQLGVYFGNEEGTFATDDHYLYEFPGVQAPGTIAVSNTEGGAADRPLLLVGLYSRGESEATLLTFRNTGARTDFEILEGPDLTVPHVDSGIGDIDGSDGRELWTAHESHITVLPAIDEGVAAEPKYVGSPTEALLLRGGRFDATGARGQIALFSAQDGQGALHLLLNPPGMTRVVTVLARFQAQDMAVGLLNGDGLDDVVAAGGESGLFIFRSVR